MKPSTQLLRVLQEIPLDASFPPEGGRVRGHFCGLECYQRFPARASTATETSVNRTPLYSLAVRLQAYPT
ncbi:DUF3330 domain-containing protein [Escherichia coli]|nr:DUF3330 domain-containing protein [Escherichia coli]MCY0185819.1 DUF3330 domain-containing protein [Escherichia coli]